jgi:hypothetical protein
MGRDAGGSGLFPDGFDPIYFADESWSRRVKLWADAEGDAGFSGGNLHVVRQVLDDPDTGLRMVVNITADALLSMIDAGQYYNLYDEPVIGGEPRKPTATRLQVDEMLDVGPGYYFGAVALGGTGVRFYGEYCMVIDPRHVPAETRLFDRDSYDLLLDPLADPPLNEEQLLRLRGWWKDDEDDVVAMALLRVLPQVGQGSRLVTSGTISEAVLKDQEFIEVHLARPFGHRELEEVRESPDDAATELTIAERERHGLYTSYVEREWRRRRARVAEYLDEHAIRHRIVTLHGRGYQWK